MYKRQLARGLKKFDQHTDEDEFIDIEDIKPEEVRRMLLDEEIFDAKTLSALCMMQLVNKNFIWRAHGFVLYCFCNLIQAFGVGLVSQPAVKSASVKHEPVQFRYRQ